MQVTSRRLLPKETWPGQLGYGPAGREEAGALGSPLPHEEQCGLGLLGISQVSNTTVEMAWL
jgi:hypothetical protein